MSDPIAQLALLPVPLVFGGFSECLTGSLQGLSSDHPELRVLETLLPENERSGIFLSISTQVGVATLIPQRGWTHSISDLKNPVSNPRVGVRPTAEQYCNVLL